MSEPVIVLTHTPEELTRIYTADAVEQLGRLGRIIANPYDYHLPPAELYALASNATVVVSEWNTGADTAYLSRAPELLAFIRSGVEILNVDFEAETAAGILVVNTPGLYTTAVVELVLGYLVILARDVVGLHTQLRSMMQPAQQPIGFELCGQVLGIVGLGDIGRQLTRVARSLGMKVLAYDPFVTSPPDGVEMVVLDDLLRRSRFVSLHAKLTPQTRSLIGIRELALMRPDAFLINTSRGLLVDEAALADALRRGSLAGAAVDVFSSEPNVLASPLIDAPNVLLTPHIGGWSRETFERQAQATVVAVERVLRGECPDGVVNRNVLPHARFHGRRL